MRVQQRLLPPKEAADLIIVGQIGAPYGVKGWSHIQSFTSPVESILTYHPWYIKHKDGWVLVENEVGRRHGESVVVKLKGVEDRDRAAMFTQSKIAVKRSQLAVLPKDVFYWTDLEGLSVKLTSGESWGHIRHLYQNAGTDIMLIDHEGKEYHIPFIMHDTVVKVDFDLRQVIVDWDFAYQSDPSNE